MRKRNSSYFQIRYGQILALLCLSFQIALGNLVDISDPEVEQEVGLFAVGYDRGKDEVYTIDGREEAPSAFGPERFRDTSGSIIRFRERITGGNPVGVPGTLAACVLLLEEHGTLSLSEVMQPAIQLAKNGIPVSHIFAANLQEHWDRLSQFEDSRRIFGGNDGRPLEAGDIYRNPELAATLQMIAQEGIDYFYRGPLAVDIVATVVGDDIQPGVLSLEDLANYRAVRRKPVQSEFGNYTIYGMNMPSSGGVTLALMLNLIAETDYVDYEPFLTEALQRMVDVQNLAFADRNRYLADADFVDIPVNGLLDPKYAKERIELLKDDRILSTPIEPGLPEMDGILPVSVTVSEEGASTTHFTVVDSHRNMIAITSTLEQHFGSAITVPGRGFLLNNELTDFDRFHTDSSGRKLANAAEGGHKIRRSALGDDRTSMGGKRPRSSMTPTIVLRNGDPYLTIGSPGGSRITGVTFNVLLHLLLRDMELQQAINAPRIISRNGTPELESPLFRQNMLLDELNSRKINPIDAQAVGAVQAIQVGEDGWLYGAADPRREGFAIGY